VHYDERRCAESRDERDAGGGDPASGAHPGT
jgi:hypothetical protein